MMMARRRTTFLSSAPRHPNHSNHYTPQRADKKRVTIDDPFGVRERRATAAMRGHGRVTARPDPRSMITAQPSDRDEDEMRSSMWPKQFYPRPVWDF